MKNPEESHAISLLVANKPGVLIRISLVFARRGYNIDSLVVSRSHDPRFSSMTIVASGDKETLTQIINQLNKLVDVVHAKDHTGETMVEKELVLVKLHCSEEQRTSLLQIVEHFKGQTVDLTENTMMVQITGNPEKLDAVEASLDKYKIIEMIRSGKLIMSRGKEAT